MFRPVAALRALAAAAWLVAGSGGAAEAPAGREIQLSPEQALSFAATLVLKDQLPEAKRLLADLQRGMPGHPQLRFLLAEIAVREGRDRDAVALYRGMLDEDSTRVRVRLELARALLRLGDLDAARYHFELALGEDLPPAARDNVLAFLRRIQSQSSRLTVSLLITPDSNPNRGSTEDTVRLLGRTFTLNPDAKAHGGAGLTALADGRWVFGEEHRAFLHGYAEHRDYRGDYADFTYVQGTAGRHWPVGRHVWTAEAGPVGAWFRGTSLYTGATAQFAHASPLGDRVLGTQTLQFKRLDYVTEFDALDADQTWAGAGLQWSWTGRTTVGANLSVGVNDARERPYSHHAISGMVGLSHEFGIRLNAQLRLIGQRYDYQERLPLFDVARTDRYWELALDLVPRAVTFAGFAPKFTFGHARNASTIELYTYARTYVGFGITRDF
ncbi:MAG: surface lipoprotein assembly modifier [Burkholderiales bacterium]